MSAFYDIDGIEIRLDDLSGEQIRCLLEEHLSDMKSVSPPESKHALDLKSLRSPEVSFWSTWQNDVLLAGGAIKELDRYHGEIKSMRTSKDCRRKGIASILLEYLLAESRKRGYRLISLETGSMPFFAPARKLYQSFGFEECEPFASYKKDPNSVFMALKLSY